MTEYPQYQSQYPLAPVAPARAKFHGLAIAGFVCALVGIIFGLIPLTFIMAFILGTIAIVFGAIGRAHGLGKAGLILGIIAIILGIVGAVIVNNAVNDLNTTLDCISTSSTTTDMSQC